MKKLYTKNLMAALSAITLLMMVQSVSYSQVPQGFNYQAIARDGSGNPIAGATISVRLSILTDTTGFYATGAGTYLWEETHSNVKTNAFGLFTVVLGNPNAVKFQGSASSFSAINWAAGPLYMGTKIFHPGSWKIMGSAKLWTVPYAMISGGIGGALPKLNVSGITADMNEALFEVKNNAGQTVFAVYNEGIRAYVDNGIAKGGKGGFAIGGFGSAKAPSQNLMTISPDSARIYVNETAAKGNKGGFAIGGFSALKGNTGEFMFLTPSNYFVGHSSGSIITTGLYNSTLGYQSGKSLTSADNNVFIGYQSGFSTVGGSSNIFIGTTTGYSNTSGYWNIILGRSAGYFNTTGWGNIIVGDWAGRNNSTGYQNVMIGDYAGGYNTTGYSNVFLGASAGNLNTTGSYNSFIGFNSGLNNTIGQYNTYLGYKAGYSGLSASGSNNIFVGVESGFSNTTGNDNIAIGNLAGRSNLDGTYNIMIGTNAGNLNVSGNYNSMIGYKTGEKTTANWNTMLGYEAGNSNTTGGSQVMIGYTAGSGNTGSYNTMVGSVAGSASGAGSFNTYIGLAAGQMATGNQNVFIGKWAGQYEYTNSNKLIIESIYNGTDNFNNALVYGDFATKFFRVNGEIFSSTSRTYDYAASFSNTGGAAGNYGIKILCGTADGSGTSYPVDFFNSGGAWEGSISLASGTLSLYNTSDKRLKQNISKSGINALKVLNDLTVVDFSYSKTPDVKHTGYIAQDAQKVLPEMVIYNEKEDVYATSYNTLIPVLHKAILEQQQMIDLQAKKIDELEKMVRQLLIK